MEEKKNATEGKDKEGKENEVKEKEETETDNKLFSVPDLVYDNSYQLEPLVYFNAGKVDTLAARLLESELAEVVYDPEKGKEVALQLSKKALMQVKALELSRYKIVCVVQIGDLKTSPSLISSSRCLWNKATDNFSAAQYSNTTLHALLLIFSLYCE